MRLPETASPVRCPHRLWGQPLAHSGARSVSYLVGDTGIEPVTSTVSTRKGFLASGVPMAIQGIYTQVEWHLVSSRIA
jgi:hypothetical protein